MNADPEVMRFIGDPWTRPIDEFRRMHSRRLAGPSPTDQIGTSVRLKSTGEFLGLCWLAPCKPLDGRVELAYRYIRCAWGKGYATEAGRALASVGANLLGLDRIWAIVHPDNAASIRVLEKLQFAYVEDIYHAPLDRDIHVYVLDCARRTGQRH